MGASESSPLSSQKQGDEITTIATRSKNADPILEKLNSLKITTPILTSPPTTESSLTDILVRKPSSSSSPGTLNPKVLLELFSMYKEWEEEKIEKISKRQEVENKIDVVDALAVKLLQRFNYSVSSMRTSSHHLSEVHALQVEIGELKGRLTEVVSNCDALCKRIISEGPESLKWSIKPLEVMTTESEIIGLPTTAQQPQNHNTPTGPEQTAETTTEPEASCPQSTAQQTENSNPPNRDAEQTD